MTRTKSNNTARHGSAVPEAKKPVDCTDCLWAHLVQYDAPRDPLLAECTAKPQPHSARFPYQVEVARAMKLCPMHKHTDAVRTPEIRAKVRHHPMACHVVSRTQQSAI
jgi:hypothetical protein